MVWTEPHGTRPASEHDFWSVVLMDRASHCGCAFSKSLAANRRFVRRLDEAAYHFQVAAKPGFDFGGARDVRDYARPPYVRICQNLYMMGTFKLS